MDINDLEEILRDYDRRIVLVGGREMLNEAALRWMNELSAQGIFMTDAELTICGWNHWLEIRSGHTASNLIGRNLLQEFPELVERGLDQYYRDALAGQIRLLSHRLHRYLLPMKPQIDETSFRFMQQSARIAPLIEHENIVGTITIIDDVTERIAREEQLVRLLGREKAARKEAEAANRSKDEFLATVSHELRTPLNAIAGWVQIMRSKKLNPESYAHGLEIIDRNVKVQTKIIEDILDVSRIISGKLNVTVVPVNLVPVIESALDAMRLAAEARSIRLESSLDPDTCLVSGDPNRLQQIVWNLVSNAIKFTPKDGTVRVRLSRVDSMVEIAVSDTGSGISAEFLPFVFDRFRQADSTSTRQHSGLGLGLAIVRHLVEIHGGTVHAASPGEGHGATFIVRLPLIPSIATDAPAPQTSESVLSPEQDVHSSGKNKTTLAPESVLRGVRVLIIDDEQDAREMLEAILAQHGAEVRVSGSTDEALKIFDQWVPEILVSDIGMPYEDGYSLIDRVRAREPDRGGNIPAIALTGYARPEDRLRLLSSGYQDYLSKPVEMRSLIDAVANLVGRVREDIILS